MALLVLPELALTRPARPLGSLPDLLQRPRGHRLLLSVWQRRHTRSGKRRGNGRAVAAVSS
ncbi:MULTISPECIES: hypothetical protein, partial [unclassified Streptomyces]|uniref:hypothetical protein n=1 Tax=unclassified Streptomyces TaxID=2593676 RepID=UPI0018680EBF